ncbi:50S ribosomal protein L25/general stress protein Ctc [Leptospira wolffii]|uniref:Large ribosomal subunit protein bL25 n=1 Tax=Leptospira wolffii TaxID=409998 RepID=A0A2M9Z957_9LEPT|nr:50S ribosomal protein L25/general stress protein Ctc [Leptospira wolffii]EPG65720.1 ribosomal protein L25, Ctc-form [Leptospira wolffii serovar Khorat str. Khorat-H2]PJZ64966.1 50S ribosomal protein L25 [Leptospira wolffii]TGK58127.1 50S ribosomal protein L25/general stress protein Ctc [Leptospira wolffii]TGK68806.1 50S ribosomal protein L25/general stress protein Ctc [Leptospira wolffii]TGK76354.1 50S ribosomal protein L25/general stress protein Ctc [Leptospira wolffii]
MSHKIVVKKRTETGKNVNNRLRASGQVPINIIGGGKAASGAVNEKELDKLVHSGIRQSTLIDLDVEGEGVQKVFVKEIQRFPEIDRIRHVDFYKVEPGKKIITKIGIRTEGTAKGSKMGGQFDHLIHEIRVKTVPEDLLETLVLDVTDLDVGDFIKVSNLKVPASWEILVNGDPIVAAVLKTKALLAQERAEAKEASGAKGKDGKKGK